jgi:hypothetical protein
VPSLLRSSGAWISSSPRSTRRSTSRGSAPVEGEHLGILAQALPMTYMAANAADDTVSTSFAGLLVAQAVIAESGG